MTLPFAVQDGFSEAEKFAFVSRHFVNTTLEPVRNFILQEGQRP